MSGKQYLNAFVNSSATIRGVLAADITDAPHKAVAYNSGGKLILPTADGAPVIGVMLSDVFANDSGITPAECEADVLVKDIGLVEVGAAVAKGDFLTATTAGVVRKAAAGEYILGIAMTAAAAAGELVQVYITHSGFLKAAGGGSSSPSAGS